MRPEYKKWLADQKYQENTQNAQLHRVKKVEEYYGNLDEHFLNGTYQQIVDSLQYSSNDERSNKPNPSRIKFEGNIRKNLQSYKDAVIRYKTFLKDNSFDEGVPTVQNAVEKASLYADDKQQRLSLERDMQAALRNNISCLNESLNIIDDGAERAVESGLIDILCEDDYSIVVVELKAGKADSRAIAQILGYMGDLMIEEDKPVRGILIAHEFDQRAKSAAKAVPNLSLKRYSIEFKFTDDVRL
jgi:hypothetical protein